MRVLFVGEPFVTIHMSAKERKDMDEFNRKKYPVRKNMAPQPNFNLPNYPQINFGMGMSPNPSMFNQNTLPGIGMPIANMHNMNRPIGNLPPPQMQTSKNNS